jgi:hypothetical protein
MSIIAVVETAAGAFSAGMVVGAVAFSPRVIRRGRGPVQTPAPDPAPSPAVTPPAVVVVQAAPTGTTALPIEDLATLAEAYGMDAAGFASRLVQGVRETPAIPRTSGGAPR